MLTQTLPEILAGVFGLNTERFSDEFGCDLALMDALQFCPCIHGDHFGFGDPTRKSLQTLDEMGPNPMKGF